MADSSHTCDQQSTASANKLNPRLTEIDIVANLLVFVLTRRLII
ncbi:MULTISPECIES: hypothetical protein [unclassified Microcoleus]